MQLLYPFFFAFINSLKCFVPRAVIASGNSAILFSLTRVTFLTSKKYFSLLLEIKKSNLVFSENFTSDFIINITNDSWFGDFFGPYQHFYLAKMRAAEFNKPIIRVSNNGISGIFDQNGKILKTTSLNKKEILNFSLKINNKKNLIFYHNLLNQLIIFIFLIFIYLIIKKRWKK